jgi:hypothetical protein
MRLLIPALLLALPLCAAKRIVFDMTSNGTSGPVVLIVDTARLRIDAGGQRAAMYFMGPPDRVVVLDRAANQYTEFSQETATELASRLTKQMDEMLGKMSPEIREQMLKTLASVPKPKAEFRAGGESSAKGIPCRTVTLAMDGKDAAEFCMAKPDDLKLAPEDAAVFIRLQGFEKDLAKTLSQSVPVGQVPGLLGAYPPFQEGLPVRILGLDGERIEFKSIEEVSVSDADFSTGSAVRKEVFSLQP